MRCPRGFGSWTCNDKVIRVRQQIMEVLVECLGLLSRNDDSFCRRIGIFSNAHSKFFEVREKLSVVEGRFRGFVGYQIEILLRSASGVRAAIRRGHRATEIGGGRLPMTLNLIEAEMHVVFGWTLP